MTDTGWEIFDGHPEAFCHCKCSEVYESHAKATYPDRSKRRPFFVSRKPCPACGRHDYLRKVEDPPGISP